MPDILDQIKQKWLSKQSVNDYIKKYSANEQEETQPISQLNDLIRVGVESIVAAIRCYNSTLDLLPELWEKESSHWRQPILDLENSVNSVLSQMPSNKTAFARCAACEITGWANNEVLVLMAAVELKCRQVAMVEIVHTISTTRAAEAFRFIVIGRCPTTPSDNMELWNADAVIVDPVLKLSLPVTAYLTNEKVRHYKMLHANFFGTSLRCITKTPTHNSLKSAKNFKEYIKASLKEYEESQAPSNSVTAHRM